MGGATREPSTTEIYDISSMVVCLETFCLLDSWAQGELWEFLQIMD